MVSPKRSSPRLWAGAAAAATAALLWLWLSRPGEGAAPQAPAARAADSSASPPPVLADSPALAPDPGAAGAQVARAAPAAPVAPPEERAAVFVVEEAERVEPPDGAAHAHRLQYWRGRIAPPVEAWAAMGLGESEGVSLSFALPGGELVPVVFRRFERLDERKGVYLASVEGQPFAEAMFSYVNDSVSGVVRFPDRGVSWEIRNAGGGAQYFEQVDLTKLGVCAACRRD